MPFTAARGAERPHEHRRRVGLLACVMALVSGCGTSQDAEYDSSDSGVGADSAVLDAGGDAAVLTEVGPDGAPGDGGAADVGADAQAAADAIAEPDARRDGDGDLAEAGDAALGDTADAADADAGQDLACGPLQLSVDGVLDVDLAIVRVTGRVTLDAADLPDAAATRGWLRFEDRTTGSSARLGLGESGPAHYDVTLTPGRYDVIFEGDGESCGHPDGVVPCGAGRVLSDVWLHADGVLDVDVPAVAVSGLVTLNGDPLPGGEPRGWLSFDSGWGPPARVDLGSSGPGSYAVRLVAGRYALDYVPADAGCPAAGVMPCGPGRVATDVSLNTGGVLDVNLAMAHVQGRVTANGATLADAAGERGRLRFTRPDGGSLELPPFAATGEALYEVRLLTGSYAVAWDGEPALCDPGAPAVDIPCHDGPLLSAVPIVGDGVLDIDLPVVRVSGAVTVDEGGFPLTARALTALRFEQHGGGWLRVDELGSAPTARYDVALLAGRFDVVFEGLGAACPFGETSPVPCNTGPIRRGLDLRTDGVLDLDVARATVGGQVRLDEGDPLDVGDAPGALTFEVDGGVPLEVPAFTASPAAYRVTLLAGHYRLGWAPDDGRCQLLPPPATPCLPGTLLADVPVERDGVLDVDVPVVSLTGRVSVDGRQPAAWGGPRGRLVFSSLAGEGAFWLPPFGATGPLAYEARLLPGPLPLDFVPPDDLCDQTAGPGLPCTRQPFDSCED